MLETRTHYCIDLLSVVYEVSDKNLKAVLIFCFASSLLLFRHIISSVYFTPPVASFASHFCKLVEAEFMHSQSML